jgi:hypothetical protein
MDGFTTKEEIDVFRKELEKSISEVLKQAGGDLNLEDIKELVYNEKEHSDFHRLIAMFDFGGDFIDLPEALEMANDAWNYFPHKCLKGLSPAEKLLEYSKDGVKKKKK